MKNRILSVRLSEDERNDQRGDEPAVPDIILIRNQYPDAAALHRVLDYVCRSGMIRICPAHGLCALSSASCRELGLL